MSTGLIPTFQNRPPVIKVGQVTEFISIHDAYFLAEKKRRREEILKWHPDRHAQWAKKGPRKYEGGKFRTLQASYKYWYLEERIWYWRRGNLMPPDWRGQSARPPVQEYRSLGRLRA